MNWSKDWMNEINQAPDGAVRCSLHPTKHLMLLHVEGTTVVVGLDVHQLCELRDTIDRYINHFTGSSRHKSTPRWVAQ